MTTERKKALHAIAQTERLLDQLVADGLVELDGSYDRPSLVEAITTGLIGLADRTRPASAFGEWLSKQRGVAEVFASDDELEAAIEGWRRAVVPIKTQIAAPRSDDDRDAAMELRIVAEPHNAELVAVYRDWLVERGNPLGELFAYAETPKARHKTLTAHARYFWGRLHQYRQLFDLEWGIAGVHAVTITRVKDIEIEWPIVVSWLLELPITRFLRELRVGPLPARSVGAFEATVDAILAHPRPALRVLHVNATSAGDTRNRASLGSIAGLRHALPHLRELAIIARRARLEMLDHPELEAAVFDLEAVTADSALAIASGRCPALSDLDLHLTMMAPFRIEAFCEATGFPRLKRLGLEISGPAGKEVVLAILKAPWLPQLRELDLSGLQFDDEARLRLASARRELAHLARIVLHAPTEELIRTWGNLVPGRA